MKIAVIGCGFVGGTVANFLEKHNIEVIRVDPKYYQTPLPYAIENADGIIIALPTPTDLETGVPDVALVVTTCNEIAQHRPTVPILLKSTFVTNQIESLLTENVTMNPEFLREAHAEQDFINQQHFILGIPHVLITENTPAEHTEYAKFWTDLFAPLLPTTNFVYTDRETASMIKYAHNAWLATKVAWFHELYYKLPAGVNWETMTKVLGEMPNIGPSHMNVPNSEGTLGYSGNCFPKDVKAMIGFTDHKILCEAETINEKLKKKVFDINTENLVPNEPYIVCIGTSHTFGECDDKQIDNYCVFLSKMLDMKVIRVGNPGTDNQELLQMVNELDQIGMFGDNCKMVILEPRLTDNTISMSYEDIVVGGWDQVVKEMLWENKAFSPLINRSSLRMQETNENGEIRFRPSVNDGLYAKLGIASASADGLVEHVGQNFDRDQQVDKITLRGAAQAAEYLLGVESKTVKSAFQDMQIIQMIKNFIDAKGIPFTWFVFDIRSEFIKKIQQVYKTDIFNQMLFKRGITELLAYELTGTIDPQMGHVRHLLCECQHYNEDGSMMIAEKLYPHVKRILDEHELSSNQ